MDETRQKTPGMAYRDEVRSRIEPKALRKWAAAVTAPILKISASSPAFSGREMFRDELNRLLIAAAREYASDQVQRFVERAFGQLLSELDSKSKKVLR